MVHLEDRMQQLGWESRDNEMEELDRRMRNFNSDWEPNRLANAVEVRLEIIEPRNYKNLSQRDLREDKIPPFFEAERNLLCIYPCIYPAPPALTPHCPYGVLGKEKKKDKRKPMRRSRVQYRSLTPPEWSRVCLMRNHKVVFQVNSFDKWWISR